jgi:hypothetical protein
MPNVLNRAGNEVEIDDWLIAQMRRDGTFHGFDMLPTTRQGNGPANRVALLVANNGIGDDIHAMPAIAAKVAAGYSVDVYGRPFTRECYTSVGASFYDYRSLGVSNTSDLLRDYGSGHYLSQWCLRHEHETDGMPTQSRFEQFAHWIGATLPDAFDWRATFASILSERQTRVDGGYIVTALTATSPHRSYQQAQTLYRELQRFPALPVIAFGDLPNEERAESFAAMLRVIDGASVVVSVDTGPLQIALALGVRCVALFGGTHAGIVVGQYERYSDRVNAIVLQDRSEDDRCFRPCSFIQSRGFRNKGKCEKCADCLESLTPQHIAGVARNYALRP